MHRSIGDTGHMCLAFEKVFVSSFLKKAHVYLCSLQVSSSLRIPWVYTEKIGFHADFDQQVREDLRFVQLTPPGSACSEPSKCGSTRSSMSSTFSGSIQTAYSGDASREVFLIASLT